MLPSALLTASAYAISTDFGAESSRPASLLCTLRTHQSPGEWQHSLPACSLALAGRDFHPLDFFKWFPPPSLLVPPPPRFSQRDRSVSENWLFETDLGAGASTEGYPIRCASANDGTAAMIGILGSILFPLSSFF